MTWCSTLCYYIPTYCYPNVCTQPLSDCFICRACPVQCCSTKKEPKISSFPIVFTGSKSNNKSKTTKRINIENGTKRHQIKQNKDRIVEKTIKKTKDNVVKKTKEKFVKTGNEAKDNTKKNRVKTKNRGNTIINSIADNVTNNTIRTIKNKKEATRKVETRINEDTVAENQEINPRVRREEALPGDTQRPVEAPQQSGTNNLNGGWTCTPRPRICTPRFGTCTPRLKYCTPTVYGNYGRNYWNFQSKIHVCSTCGNFYNVCGTCGQIKYPRPTMYPNSNWVF